jgi:cytochrome b561/polyisoprenoid-binding protein YceI
MPATVQRYTAVAIVLHWAIAAAILFMIPLGFWMHETAEDGHASVGLFAAYQLHKSIGLTVLALSLVRLGWRLANPPPLLPAHMPGWEKLVAKLTHWAFYGLMIGLPLTGWLYVSAGWSIHDEAPLPVPTHWFGLFEVPHLFGLNQASLDVREDAAEAALTAHAYLGFAALGLAALHVAAALKHHLFDKDETLAHMVPGLRAPFETEPPPKNPVRLAVLGVGLSLVVVAAAAALFTVATLNTTPAQAPSTFEVVEENAAQQAPEAATADETTPLAPTAMPHWIVDARSSSIGFTYSYEDENGATPFNGRFARWRADIQFDPANLDASSAVVRIETASAATGVGAHDAALPTSEWFDAGANPTAEFRTTRIRSRGGNQYEARGRLTIRAESRDIDLPFTLSIDGDRASMRGSTTIDRRDFGIGTDGSGDDLISRDIQLTIRVDADRAR